VENIITNTQIHGHRVRSISVATGKWLSMRIHVLGKILILVLAMSITASSSYGQDKVSKKAHNYFKEADYAIGLGELETAKEKLQLALKAQSNYVRARLYLADLHFIQENYQDALAEYLQLKDLDTYPSRVDQFLARTYFALGSFDSSIESMETYLLNDRLTAKTRREGELLINNAQFSITAVAAPLAFDPIHLGEEVNSENSEYMPSLNADESTVIFTRLIRGQEDLYITAHNADGWKKAEPIEEGVITTGHNEGAHCISADGQVLLFTICNEKFTKGSCDLYISKKKGNQWSAPKNIGPPVNSVSWDSQPSLSADGKRVYFVSNRNGGYGGTDIWYADWNDEKWAEPVNMGPEINTPFNEQTPSIHFDNQTLYFSSDGHPGLGMHDIYFTRLKDEKWSTPVNLGYPINTNQVESGLDVTLQGIKAYYAAERPDGFGGLDIYEFDLPEFARPQRVTYVKALIVDSETKMPVNAEFQLSDLTFDQTDISGNSVDGEFLICLPSGNDYGLQVNSNGYVFESLNFALKDTVQREAYVLTIEIESVDTGISTVLKNVFFETDSYDLLPASDTELTALYDLLQKHKDIRVEIGGHTDNTGTATHNLSLSQDRAQSVVNYLSAKGIDPSRLAAKGYGDEVPRADNNTEEGRAMNRRTEFTVIE